jgi:hypothetical protein
MNDFAKRIEPDIPIFFENFEKGTDAFSNMANLYKTDLTSNNESQVQNAEISLDALISGIKSGIRGMTIFFDSVAKFPRLEKELNIAKRLVESKLTELISKLRIALDIASELKKNL